MTRLVLVALVTVLYWKHDRLRHLAVPVLTRPEQLEPAKARALEEASAVELQKIASYGARVTALLETQGQLWAGTFDRGVFRGQQQLEGSGREQFVNAMVEHEGSVFAATYSGVLEYDARDGTLKARHLAGIATEALVLHRGELVAGTIRGVYRGFVRAPGRELRVTALAVNGEKLWVGTPSGVYEGDGTWHPLVFGPEASSTNVVLALAPFGEGVLATTDDGGLVDVQPGKEVRALRFTEPRANEGNPGAVLVSGSAVLVGTQGGGLLEVRGQRVARPRGWKVPIVSALAPGLLGDGAGNVYAAR